MENKTKTKKIRKNPKKISKKEGYKKGKEIIEALEDNDKEALQKTTYVCYDDIIEFPKSCAFTIKRLKQIVREAEKYNKTGGEGMLVGIEFKIEEKNMTAEMKQIMKANRGRKIIATKTKEIK